MRHLDDQQIHRHHLDDPLRHRHRDLPDHDLGIHLVRHLDGQRLDHLGHLDGQRLGHLDGQRLDHLDVGLGLKVLPDELVALQASCLGLDEVLLELQVLKELLDEPSQLIRRTDCYPDVEQLLDVPCRMTHRTGYYPDVAL